MFPSSGVCVMSVGFESCIYIELASFPARTGWGTVRQNVIGYLRLSMFLSLYTCMKHLSSAYHLLHMSSQLGHFSQQMSLIEFYPLGCDAM
jgi:hypothetical protein